MGLNDRLLNALSLHVVQLGISTWFPQIALLSLDNCQLIAGGHSGQYLHIDCDQDIGPLTV